MEDVEILFKLRREIQEAKEVHSQLAFSIGVYYGYPLCCRVAFSEDILRDRDSAERNIDGSGFIPCRAHWMSITGGEMKLSDLITNRICPEPLKPITTNTPIQ